MFKIICDSIKSMTPILERNTINLERFCYSDIGTFGKLTYNEFSCFTVERPWKNNIPFVSCIPDGSYKVKWHNSPKFGTTLAVYGGSVSIQKQYEYDRYAILFHAGNWPTDFEGCIGVGRSLRCINGELGVTSSRDTLNELFLLLQNRDDISLNIFANTGTHYE